MSLQLTFVGLASVEVFKARLEHIRGVGMWGAWGAGAPPSFGIRPHPLISPRTHM